MKCVACGSEDIEDIREMIDALTGGVTYVAIQLTVVAPTDEVHPMTIEKREYDMYECKKCGHLMLSRRKEVSE